MPFCPNCGSYVSPGTNVCSCGTTIELFFKITFGGNLKRHFRTTRGAYKRMKFNEIQWSRRNVLTIA